LLLIDIGRADNFRLFFLLWNWRSFHIYVIKTSRVILWIALVT